MIGFDAVFCASFWLSLRMNSFPMASAQTLFGLTVISAITTYVTAWGSPQFLVVGFIAATRCVSWAKHKIVEYWGYDKRIEPTLNFRLFLWENIQGAVGDVFRTSGIVRFEKLKGKVAESR
jgi:hypothetical protein